ncbi:uncharacterized protein TNCV_3751681 [Trichonephila clavipes]|nr:uncharacterized protein TNCV_3751681 [Trichonephila clavipes]
MRIDIPMGLTCKAGPDVLKLLETLGPNAKDKLSDKAENQEIKEILRSAMEENLQKRTALVTNNDSINPTDSTNNPKNTKTKAKGKNKKRKIKKDSPEDFVFPKKTARPVSSSVSEPVTTANSFSDLEPEKEQAQVVVDDNTTEIPKPKPPSPIHLMIKKNIRDQLKIIYQTFPNLQNKSSGKFIKLLANDDIEYHELTQLLEADKDFEFYVIKPKINKPIKIVIKGLPIFT